ncbi:MAG: DUF1015 family protein [Desulfuromonadales bacterium]|nr:DUF1015 family protein [Desulfuromonadales bacterium]
MAVIKPFKGLRPPKAIAHKVAALPYDVMSTAEALRMADGNPYSFLHISRPEIDLPADVDMHSIPVYEKGRENLSQFIKEGTLIQDAEDCYYIYRQKMGKVVQTGLVACSSVDDYQSGVVKKHELTRADKEEDRVKHIDYINANDEPVFYTYRRRPSIVAVVESVINETPEYDFKTEDGVSHTLWIVNEKEVIEKLTEEFAEIPSLYVADGHHRSAAASRVRDLRKAANPFHKGNEEYNYFLTVIFPDSELNIMSYNRVIKDLNGYFVEDFLQETGKTFDVTLLNEQPELSNRHNFGMYVNSKWYRLIPKEGSFNRNDPVEALDVSILQKNLLEPVLGISNPRTDQRINFVGGIRGLAELEKLVDSGDYAVAFALFHTTIKELMELADVGEIMPPKSTWFEPKLRSGLFAHLLYD